MKNFLVLILSLCFVLCLTACSDEETFSEATNNESQITSTDTQASKPAESADGTTTSPKSIKILLENEYELIKIEHDYPEIKNLKDISVNKNLFITNDGSLYYISFDKLCSNNKYCIKIDSNIKFSKFLYNIENEVLLSTDNELYDCIYTDGGWEVIKANDAEHHLEINNIEKNDFQKIMYIPSLKNGKVSSRGIYHVKDTYLEHRSNPTQKRFNKYLSEIEWYGGNTIKSQGQYFCFYNKQTNVEECSKYADVKPIYELDFHKVDIPVDDVAFFKHIGYTIKNANGYSVIVDSAGVIYINQHKNP